MFNSLPAKSFPVFGRLINACMSLDLWLRDIQQEGGRGEIVLSEEIGKGNEDLENIEIFGFR